MPLTQSTSDSPPLAPRMLHLYHVLAMAALGAAALLGLASPVPLLLMAVCLMTMAIGADRRFVTGLVAGYGTCYLLVYSSARAPSSDIRISTLVTAVAIFVAVHRAQRHPSNDAISKFAAWAAIVALISMVVGSIQRPELRSLIFLQTPIAVAFFAAGSRFTLNDMRTYSRVIIGFAVIESLDAVLQYRGLRDAPWPSYDSSTYIGTNSLTGSEFRSEGLLGHAIPLSLLLVTGVILTWLQHAQLRLSVRVFLTALFLGAIVLTGTRTAILALIIALIAAFLSLRGSTRVRASSGVALLVGVIAMMGSPRVASYASEVVGNLQSSGSYQHRRGVLDSIPSILNNSHGITFFFGSGMGSESNLFQAGIIESGGFSVVDNQFVTSLVWSGIVGLLALLALFVIAYISGSLTAAVLSAAMLVYLNSFDVFRWTGPAILAITWLAFARAPELRTPPRTGKKAAEQTPALTGLEKKISLTGQRTSLSALP